MNSTRKKRRAQATTPWNRNSRGGRRLRGSHEFRNKIGIYRFLRGKKEGKKKLHRECEEGSIDDLGNFPLLPPRPGISFFEDQSLR